MDKNLLKQYKFVYYRVERNWHFVDADAAANYDKKYPKMVIANKNPDKHEYRNENRWTPATFKITRICELGYSHSVKSLTEAEWYKVLLASSQKYLAQCRKEMRQCEKDPTCDLKSSYYYNVRVKNLPTYVAEVKEYKRKVAEFEAAGVYTYIELMK